MGQGRARPDTQPRTERSPGFGIGLRVADGRAASTSIAPPAAQSQGSGGRDCPRHPKSAVRARRHGIRRATAPGLDKVSGQGMIGQIGHVRLRLWQVPTLAAPLPGGDPHLAHRAGQVALNAQHLAQESVRPDCSDPSPGPRSPNPRGPGHHRRSRHRRACRAARTAGLRHWRRDWPSVITLGEGA